MHRLASRARHRRPRGQDCPSDGWTTIKNGELLALAAKQFDAFVTVDRNLAFQQSIGALRISVIVLRAKSNRLGELKPLIPSLLTTLGAAKPGRVVFVGD